MSKSPATPFNSDLSSNFQPWTQSRTQSGADAQAAAKALAAAAAAAQAAAQAQQQQDQLVTSGSGKSFPQTNTGGSLATGATVGGAQNSPENLQVIGQVLSLLGGILPQLQPAIDQAAQSLGIGTGSSNNDGSATAGDSADIADPQDLADSSTSTGGSGGVSGSQVQGSGDDGTQDAINSDSSSASSGATTSSTAGSASSPPYADLDSIITKLVAAISPLIQSAVNTTSTQGGAGSSPAAAASTGTSSSLSASSNTQTGPGVASTTQSPATGSGVAPGSSSLAANKAAVYRAAQQAGATPSQTATILAIGQLETDNLDPSQRDKSKDGTSSQNYSAFNINKDLAEKLGWNPATGPDLNDPANTSYVVGLITKGMNQMGTDGFLAYLRGGSTGAANPSAGNVQDYLAAIHGAASQLQANPELLTNSKRVATHVAAI